MSEGPADPRDVFDVTRISELIELMKHHDLNEVDLRQAGMRIRLRRGPEGGMMMAPIAHAQAPAQAAPPVAAPAAPVVDDAIYIKSPMVGTFYTASSPDTPAYVKVGDPIAADTVVCLIEAMKVFNEIMAETSGQIVALLVDNGDPVEFGQPLFKVRRA